MPGPPRTPLAILKLRGSQHARYSRPPEMQPRPLGNCAPPDWLDDVGRRVWTETLAAMPEGVVCETDAGALALYAHSWDEFFAAKEAIDREGRWLTSSKTGGSYLHPAYGVLCRAKADIQKLGALLGLSPSDRSRIPAGAPSEPEDPCLEFMQKEAT